MTTPPVHAPREPAAQRQARLRRLAALQRDALEARWQPFAAPLARADGAIARVRGLRRHPLALALLAASATGFLVSRRSRHALALARAGVRVGLRAATVVSLWRALRATAERGATATRATAARPFTDDDAPRAPADGRPGAPGAASRSTAGEPGRRA